MKAEGAFVVALSVDEVVDTQGRHIAESGDTVGVRSEVVLPPSQILERLCAARRRGALHSACSAALQAARRRRWRGRDHRPQHGRDGILLRCEPGRALPRGCNHGRPAGVQHVTAKGRGRIQPLRRILQETFFGFLNLRGFDGNSWSCTISLLFNLH